MMNDYFIKKYNEKRIRSSKTQNFFLKKKKKKKKQLRKGRMSTKENNLKKKKDKKKKTIRKDKGMFGNCFFSLFYVSKNNFLFLKLKNLIWQPKIDRKRKLFPKLNL